MKKVFLLLLSGLVFTACTRDDEEPENPDEPTPTVKCSVVEVSDDIKEPTIWKEGFVYVIKGSGITVKSVLTIQPGVIIKIKDASIDVVGGKIIANGTPEKRIVFTSIADDRYCGDTNNDGNMTNPAKGDWQQIRLSSNTTENIFKYVDIFYAGKNRDGSSNAVIVSSASTVSFTFDHCRIAHTLYQNSSYDSSCAFFGSSYMRDNTVSKFTNNAFYDNGKPIHFNAFYNLDSNNVFHNPENPSEKNTHNGIYLYYPGSASGTTVNWNNTEVPYVLNQWIGVSDPAIVNVGANVVIKLKNTSAGFQRSNPNNINIHSTAIFTSYKDDEHGGDTNGDGNNSFPTIGDWKGIHNAYPSNYHWDQNPNILYAEN